MDWNDYHYFSTIAHAGSVRGAAKNLNVNPSTVTRRLEALESHLGVLLFARTAQGLRMTPEAAAVLSRVDTVAGQIDEVETILFGTDQRLAGRIRIAVPDVLAVNFLLADLAPFMEEYSDIDLEFVPSYEGLTLSPGQIDVAIRATENPPQDMVGRPLTQIALAAYASHDYLASHPGVDTGTGSIPTAWVDWAIEGETKSLYEQLQARYFPAAHIHIRCNQIMMQYSCMQASMGVGILPCFLAEADPKLVRLKQMPVQGGPTMWLLTHPALRKARRVQVFMQCLREVFAQRKDELAGIGLES